MLLCCTCTCTYIYTMKVNVHILSRKSTRLPREKRREVLSSSTVILRTFLIRIHTTLKNVSIHCIYIFKLCFQSIELQARCMYSGNCKCEYNRTSNYMYMYMLLIAGCSVFPALPPLHEPQLSKDRPKPFKPSSPAKVVCCFLH